MNRMGTNFWCNNYWDHLGGLKDSYDWSMVSKAAISQSSEMLRLPTQMLPEIIAPKVCTHSPCSFWSGKSQGR